MTQTAASWVAAHNCLVDLSLLFKQTVYNADGRRSKFLVQETRTRILVQEICLCVVSSRASFFSYEKLGWIRTLFYSVRETWSQVVEMLRRYWLEVFFVFLILFLCWLFLVVSYFSSFWPFC